MDPNITSLPDRLSGILNSTSKNTTSPDVAKLTQFVSSPERHSAEMTTISFAPIQAIVAFIDILGTSSLMKNLSNKNAAEIIEKITGIKQIFEEEFAVLKQIFESSKLMIISDSYVISIEKEAEAFEKLLQMLAKCQYRCLLQYGEILRGAISSGAIIGGNKDPNAIIGPAFIHAHELEVKNVIFPRIIIAKQITDDVKICRLGLPILLDKDGLQYLDFACLEDIDMVALYTKSKQGFTMADDLKKQQKWNWVLTFLEQKKNNHLHCCKHTMYGCMAVK